MLNSANERELAYVVLIDAITPIEGYDRVELAHVGGWTIVVGKGEFKAGDPAIYFEIDSKLPEVEPFVNMEFLAKKKFKITTQKMCKSLSQGLLMSAKNFGWNICGVGEGQNPNVNQGICEPDGTIHLINNESRFLTKRLNVTYAVAADNSRKAPSADKYKAMSQRHPKIFSKKIVRWFMCREWGRKLMFFFFGKKKDNKNAWPYWVQKTDEERVENMLYILNPTYEQEHHPDGWVATEKLDGSSTTFTLKRGKWPHKNQFYICSRNVVLNDPNKPCYYDHNIYHEMAEKYNIKEKMEEILKDLNEEWITIQGETYGEGVQKRDYGLKERNFATFNFITASQGRFSTSAMAQIMNAYDIPHVPILNREYHLPTTIEELRAYVESEPSTIDGVIKEGIVFRSQDGSQSFKCVSPQYLLTYHQ